VEVNAYLPAIALGYYYLNKQVQNYSSHNTPWDIHDSYRSNTVHLESIQLIVNNKLHTINTTMNSANHWTLDTAEKQHLVSGEHY